MRDRSKPFTSARARRQALTVALVCSGLALTVSCAHRAPASQPGSVARAGDCHRIPTPEAMVAASDDSPVVPCTEPHDAETYATFTYTGHYANRKARPLPQQLDADIGDRCSAYSAIRAYLGAGLHDAHWGLEVWRKYPSPQQWARGDRVVRCDLVPGAGPNGPVLDAPLRGVLQRAGSARFRLCYAKGEPLTCDRPHDREVLAGPPALPAGPYPPAAALAREAFVACAPLVVSYIGRPLPADLTVKPHSPSLAQWNAGDRHVDCGVGPAEPGRLVTGTVRGGAGGS